MKPSTAICFLTIAALLSGGAVGCKKKPERTTRIPGYTSGGIENPPPAVPPSVPPIRPIDDGGVKGTPFKEGDNIPVSEDVKNWQPAADQPFKTETVYFEFDKSNVKASEVDKIERVANAMKAMPGKALRIEGHCDERGTEEYNRSLGERRALAIREYLVKVGMDFKLIDTISYGEDRPMVAEHNEAAYAKNRRGEFIVLEPPGASTLK